MCLTILAKSAQIQIRHGNKTNKKVLFKPTNIDIKVTYGYYCDIKRTEYQ